MAFSSSAGEIAFVLDSEQFQQNILQIGKNMFPLHPHFESSLHGPFV
jgi:hypothetical protein